VSPKLTRLLLVTAVAAGFGVLPMSGAQADGPGVVVRDLPTGFQQDVKVSGQCHNTKDPNQMPRVDVNKGDSVSWFFDGGNQDKHNVTPANDVPGGQKWTVGKSDDKAPGDPDPFVVKFDNAGLFFYYSSFNHEGSDNKGQLDGMCGVVRVIDPNATTTTTTTTTTPPTTAPPATQPPATTPTTPTTAHPATPTSTAPAAVIPSATHPATPAAPAPTTTATTKPEKDHKPKDDTTTTTAPQVNGPTDLPAEAIVPNVTPNGTAVQDGAVQPSSTPTGDATAIIKHKHGHGSVILLIVSGLGIGGLGVGTAAYKWANRSSRYFPA